MFLKSVSQAAASKGDGYRGQPSPHSASEMFQGVTVLKALKVCRLHTKTVLSSTVICSRDKNCYHHSNISCIVPFIHGCFAPLQLGQEGKVPLKSAQLFFNVSEKVRKMMEAYFHLETPLYFSYTHLVCRSAIDSKIWFYPGPYIPSPTAC